MCLLIAIIWFILGAFVLGNAPEWFVISGIFAALAALLGVRLVRISGVVLVVASAVVAIGEYQAEQSWRGRVREIQQKAAERKSSGIELYRWLNYPAADNAGFAPRLEIGPHWRGATEAGRWAHASRLRASLSSLEGCASGHAGEPFAL